MLWSSSFNRRFPVDTYVWVNYNDLTVLPHWNHGLFQGNHAQMAALFRLVKYYNLPIYIYIYISICSTSPYKSRFTHLHPSCCLSCCRCSNSISRFPDFASAWPQLLDSCSPDTTVTIPTLTSISS